MANKFEKGKRYVFSKNKYENDGNLPGEYWVEDYKGLIITPKEDCVECSDFEGNREMLETIDRIYGANKSVFISWCTEVKQNYKYNG